MKSVSGCLVLLGAGLLLSGCRVTNHKDGKNENVSIGTPFGSMQVKTNDNASPAATGLTQYPGSTQYKDEDNHSADVNMAFGSFHMSVHAASYLTPDGEDKVLAFYRNDLKRYGDVLQCDDGRPEGQPTRTSQGLTCDDNHGSHHANVETGSGLELRAGSPERQHIVAVSKKSGGTKIGLVSLELPSGSDKGDSASE